MDVAAPKLGHTSRKHRNKHEGTSVFRSPLIVKMYSNTVKELHLKKFS